MAKPRLVASSLIALLVLCGSLMVPASALAATTYNVTRKDDPTPNGCKATDCSLREAIIAGNNNPGAIVRLPSGVFNLTIRGQSADNNSAAGDLDIRVPMSVVGAGMGATVIQAATGPNLAVHRVFDVFAKSVSLTKLTIRYGTDQTGGCIRNTGALSVSFVTVAQCKAWVSGGGIASYRQLVVLDSVINQNSAVSNVGSAFVSGGGILGGPLDGKAGNPPGAVTIMRTRITNNTAANTGGGTAYGGGFSNAGKMTITDSVLDNNIADSSGAGVTDPRRTEPDGWMRIERTTISNNKARLQTGGIDNDGVLTVLASTFSGNEAGYQCAKSDGCFGYGGGLVSTFEATTDIVNSTFSGNKATLSGGALMNAPNPQTGQSGKLRLYNVTIVGNTAPAGAGIAANRSGLTYLQNTILAGNFFTTGDCTGVLNSGGYNFFGDPHGCTFQGATAKDIVGGDPKVGPLANNGGPTWTRALLDASPALNAGNPSGCTFGSVALTTDQRGFTRPVNGRCDIGAFELGGS